MKAYELFTDGASSGNPGPAGIGVMIRAEEGIVKTVSESIGTATNNVAEYSALIRGLREAQVLKVEYLKIRVDSQLVFYQLKGDYKVKHESMKPLHEEALKLLKTFKKIEFKVVPREENKDADRLATAALKNNSTGRDGRSLEFFMGEESPSSSG